MTRAAEQRCAKPGCGAPKVIGHACTDWDCPQRVVEVAEYRAIKARAEAAEAELLRVKGEAFETCAKIADATARSFEILYADTTRPEHQRDRLAARSRTADNIAAAIRAARPANGGETP